MGALTIGGLKLADGLAGAKAIYGRQYDPILTLQALSYFDDLRESLAEKIKSALTDAVKLVSLLSLPTVTATNIIGRADMNTSLSEIARHVNWYTDPDQVLADVNLFLAQVMARGSTEDIVTVQQRYSADDFRTAYRAAPPGLFTRRAWAYWGLMLFDNPGLPMPERFPGANRFDWRTAT